MKNPLVSVVVPVYNVKKYLKKCLDSLLAQTYKNLEIIVVDDGSTDGSEKIVDEYGRIYEKVKVFHKKNGGLSSARNLGIKKAHGQWLMFIDSDDYIRHDCIYKLIELVTEDDIDIVTFNFESFSNDGSRLKHSPYWPKGIITGFEAIDDMFKNKRPAYICMSMFRTELFKKNKIKFPEGREFEDIATRVHLLYSAKKVIYTNEKVYYYLIRKQSITGDNMSDSRCQDFLKALDEIKVFLHDMKIDKKQFSLDYFEFHSLITLLNYLAKSRDKFGVSKRYWHQVRGRARSIYFKTKFPTFRSRIVYTMALIVSLDRKLYSFVYRKAKG